MNSLKVSLLGLSLVSLAMPASGDILSYLNPAAWINAAKRAYYHSDNYRELQRLYRLQLEIDNFRKLQYGITQSLAKGTSTKGQSELIKLKNAFKKAQAQWKIVKISEQSSDYSVVMAQLTKAIEHKEQEVGKFERPSWFEKPSLYDQIKRQENLSAIQKETKAIKDKYFELARSYNSEKAQSEDARIFLKNVKELENIFLEKQKKWQVNPNTYSLTTMKLFEGVLAAELAKCRKK